MRIWVDADACPKAIKEILYRAADRTKVELVLVANRPIRTPRSPRVRLLVVSRGFDVADKRIVEEMRAGDLVITGDIPLAAAVVEKGGLALGPRGEEYTEDNVQERLAMRNLLDHLRGTGMEIGGPDALGKGDRQAFANALDRILARGGRDTVRGSLG